MWLKCPDSPAIHLGHGWARLLPPFGGIPTRGGPWPMSGLVAGRWPPGGQARFSQPQDPRTLALSGGQPRSCTAASKLLHARFASPGTCSSSGFRRRHPPSATASIWPTGQSPRTSHPHPWPTAASTPPSLTCPGEANERLGQGTAKTRLSLIRRVPQAGVAETRVLWT